MLFIGGDLNFSLGMSKILSLIAQVDPQTDFFFRKLEYMDLYDIDSVKLSPT
jgi:hypothetical protein